MLYKTDTRTDFDILVPNCPELDSRLADQLLEAADSCSENGRSLILDFQPILSLNKENVHWMEQLHKDFYARQCSLVFCHLHTACQQEVAIAGLEHTLNITPTLQEAIDMVQMEKLERELLNDL